MWVDCFAALLFECLVWFLLRLLPCLYVCLPYFLFTSSLVIKPVPNALQMAQRVGKTSRRHPESVAVVVTYENELSSVSALSKADGVVTDCVQLSAFTFART